MQLQPQWHLCRGLVGRQGCQDLVQLTDDLYILRLQLRQPKLRSGGPLHLCPGQLLGHALCGRWNWDVVFDDVGLVDSCHEGAEAELSCWRRLFLMFRDRGVDETTPD